MRTITLLLLCAFTSLAQSQPDKPTDPWDPAAIIQPAALAENMKPPIIYVGFPILYKGAHITGAIFAGPCSKPEGLDALRKAVSTLAHDQEIVIYCGCCPFVKCPNIRPAYSALKSAGFTRIRVLKTRHQSAHRLGSEKTIPSNAPRHKQCDSPSSCPSPPSPLRPPSPSSACASQTSLS